MFCRASTFTFSLVFSCLLTFFLSSCRYRWWLAGAAVCLGGGLFFQIYFGFAFFIFLFWCSSTWLWFIFLPSPYIFLPLSLRLAVR
ncbi:hypothetical protein B0H14DRAFT_2858656 [Mycena olivaceomarginata]|nr:hypothetical protein B0H14DRAFT_2858656 [Mycena olivaceomarginata]